MMEDDPKFKLANSKDWMRIGMSATILVTAVSFQIMGHLLKSLFMTFLSQDFHLSFDRDIFSLEISRSLNHVICFIFSISG